MNCGSAARSEKAAPKQSTQNGSKRSHNYGLSFLATRRVRSYQNELSWQAIFLCSGDLFCQRCLSADSQNSRRCPSSAEWQLSNLAAARRRFDLITREIGPVFSQQISWISYQISNSRSSFHLALGRFARPLAPEHGAVSARRIALAESFRCWCFFDVPFQFGQIRSLTSETNHGSVLRRNRSLWFDDGDNLPNCAAKQLQLCRFRNGRGGIAAAIEAVADLSRTPLAKRRIQVGCQL